MTILTPHPGEFSKMTEVTVKEIQQNRLRLASEYALENEVGDVLKGRNTVLAFADSDVWVNVSGNNGFAKRRDRRFVKPG